MSMSMFLGYFTECRSFYEKYEKDCQMCAWSNWSIAHNSGDIKMKWWRPLHFLQWRHQNEMVAPSAFPLFRNNEGAMVET
mmetsp:Transcript_28775/g.37152  ORF Transcript_28775/g.37152 Transcript_28775/m.37152 type:complete len:80 (+) Transcript_28775:41-280(+)